MSIRLPMNAPRDHARGAQWPARDGRWFPASDLARQKEHGDERIDREGLGERRHDDHRELDLRGRLRLPSDRLHRALADEAETDAGADGGDADAERKTETERCVEIH